MRLRHRTFIDTAQPARRLITVVCQQLQGRLAGLVDALEGVILCLAHAYEVLLAEAPTRGVHAQVGAAVRGCQVL